jgi:hypothetical protein
MQQNLAERAAQRTRAGILSSKQTKVGHTLFRALKDVLKIQKILSIYKN